MFSEINSRQAALLSKQFLGLLKPDYVSLILDEHDEHVAFGITTPSIAKALKNCNGKFFPFGFLRIICALQFLANVLVEVRDDYLASSPVASSFRCLGAVALNVIRAPVLIRPPSLGPWKKVKPSRSFHACGPPRNLPALRVSSCTR